MRSALVTVVETSAFTARAKGRMTAGGAREVISIVAANPEIGDLIQGTGGIR